MNENSIADQTKHFTIKIRIHDESELYNAYDAEGITLNSELGDYISDSMQDRNLREKPVLHIISDSDIDRERFITTLTRYSDRQMKEFKKKRKTALFNMLRMFSIGICFILLGIAVHDRIPAVSTTVIETLGSFSIWEAANVWLEQLPQLRFTERLARYLGCPDIQLDVLK